MKILSTNKRANFEFFVSDRFEAGVCLEGSEVKSVRQNGISLTDSFIFIKDNEIFLKNAYIKSYEKASNFKPDERRNRKLLMHKGEIRKLERESKIKGFSIIPTKVYLLDNRVKVEIALAKGKKLYDKRDTLKEKTIRRDMERYAVES